MQYKSQNHEVATVLEYFAGRIGMLLDCGSNDGVTFSNSYDMIQIGWSAHLVEASPTCITKSIALHIGNERVHHHNFAMFSEDGTGTLHESGAHVPNGEDYGLVSTVLPSQMNRWGDVNFKAVEVPFISFETFYQHIGTPYFEFISLDIEGLDWHVLKQIDLKRVGCEVLCIEWNGDKNIRFKVQEYCAAYGLKEIHRNAENIILAR